MKRQDRQLSSKLLSTGWLGLSESREYLLLSELIKLLINPRTESYDEMDPVGVDPRYEVFASFHDYLSDAFPLM